MPFGTLPVECLQLIISFLADQNDLFSLLITNRRLCAVTLPFLYTTPFQWFMAPQDEYRPCLHRLISVLLQSTAIKQQDLTPKLQAAFITSDSSPVVPSNNTNSSNQPSISSGIEYLACLHHLDLLKVPFEDAYEYFGDAVKDMMEEYNLVEIYQSREVKLEHNPYQQHYIVPRRYLTLELRAELIWALAHPVLDQIRTLSIPISDIQHYVDSVGQLKSLSSVSFLFDQKFDRTDFIMNLMKEQHPVRYYVIQQSKRQAMEQMVFFVQEHTRLFKGVLQTVECPKDSTWIGADQTCPPVYLKQIRACLPPHQPKALDRANWHEFMANIEQLDYSLLKRIVVPSQDQPWLQFLAQQPEGLSFLRQSKHLRVLDISSNGSRPLLWARTDAEQRRHPHPITDSSEIAETLSSLSPSSIPPMALPVEHFCLRVSSPQVKDEIDDAMFAFAPTLKSYIFRSIQPELVITGTVPSTLGDGWPQLPNLQKLKIIFTTQKMRIDPTWLSQTSSCPQLESINLEDRLQRYKCNEIVTCAPARLSKLKELRLMGSSALSFHPDSLRSCQALQSLVLGMNFFHYGTYIPPPEEIQQSYEEAPTPEERRSNEASLAVDGIQKTDDVGDSSPSLIEQALLDDRIHIQRRLHTQLRPAWTWDWNLPHLTTLHLMSEFAYRFQFRMLEGCPNLELLHLNSSTLPISDREHSLVHLRVLEEKDFVITSKETTASVDCGSSSSSREDRVREKTYLQVLKLKTVLFLGPWSFSDSVLSFMFRVVMPNLRSFEETGECIGFSVRGWMDAMDELTNLKRAITSRSLFEIEDQEEGEERKERGWLEENEDGETNVKMTAKEKETLKKYRLEHIVPHSPADEAFRRVEGTGDYGDEVTVNWTPLDHPDKRPLYKFNDKTFRRDHKQSS
ncbi:hypothetical protein BGZ83_011227 [Gryganskiella cystojenkinii]|nr:hypothetical protein BGZ83_011227 [Gryganskiella cystojenkinii]